MSPTDSKAIIGIDRKANDNGNVQTQDHYRVRFGKSFDFGVAKKLRLTLVVDFYG